MRCAKCKSENSPDHKFCALCGNRLTPACPRCGAESPVGANFCAACGAAISSPAAAPAMPPPADTAPGVRVTPEEPDAALDGERKTVTALFADIKGSTALEEKLDPEEARAIVDPALKLMIRAVHHYDGYIVQSTGDGIFALFGAPLAHEDHPQRALYAALRMQEELIRYSASLRETGNPPIEARIGVNTGEVVVRSIATGANQTEYTPIGHTANLASRMQTIAPTGSIAATDATRRLCEGYFSFRALGPTRVKGLSDPVEVYNVTGLGPLRTRLQRAAGRGLSRFVGREREIAEMRRALTLVREGRGQIVAAMGEAGLGKSRLFFEFKATSQAGCLVLETFSFSHDKASPYAPLIGLLKNYFDLDAADDARKRREKVTGKVVALDPALEDTLPYLFSLLGMDELATTLAGMDPNMRRRRTFDAIKRLLLRESLNQPVIVMCEDLHWIDAETQACLNLIADSIATAKILMLMNYRPEYVHAWGNRTYYTQLRLDPRARRARATCCAHCSATGRSSNSSGARSLSAAKAIRSSSRSWCRRWSMRMCCGATVRSRSCGHSPRCACRRRCRGCSRRASIGCRRPRRNCCRCWRSSGASSRVAWCASLRIAPRPSSTRYSAICRAPSLSTNNRRLISSTPSSTR